MLAELWRIATYRTDWRVGIEHQSVMFQNLRNSQQLKPLRPFLNVFNGLIWVVRHQELFWNEHATIFKPAANYSQTIILLEVISVEWKRQHWRMRKGYLKNRKKHPAFGGVAGSKE
jgi:hypothetical protein